MQEQTNIQNSIIDKCRQLLNAYQQQQLGHMVMPEDAHPKFSTQDIERRLAYFTLPMNLNYQRNSYALWEAALATYTDPATTIVFDVEQCSRMDTQVLRDHLMKYKLALQPNKHVSTWQTICRTIATQWGSIQALLVAADHDFLQVQRFIQQQHKKGFPYLSGPKIFHYWSFIIQKYGGVRLTHAEHIDIAPDTHIIKCSVILGVITAEEATTLSREQISQRWREVLAGSDITPISMHPPLWFWSRNNFIFRLEERKT